ncbi:MAG TPA: hypothetical protein PKA41_14570 [Verrucomicrobiota bacterium]|nr:hypothetical protein [Verrucomicrobiota bacterium]
MSENASNPETPEESSDELRTAIADALNQPRPPAPPPRPRTLPTPNHHLVAFVDILGFSEDIANATTPEALTRVYEKLLFVQQEFEKPSAVEDTEDQAALNEDYGKRVIALSDGVVIAVTDDCSGARHMGQFDFFMQEIWRMMLVQARCAVKGIFLRGGISRGTFFFEDDILLSPPLVTAYRLESKLAVHPVILIDPATKDFLTTARGRGRYSAEDDTFARYFRPFQSPNAPAQELFMLNYLPITRDEDHGWVYKEDREAYIKARDEDKSHLLYQRDVKNGAWFLGLHKSSVLAAYHAATEPQVKAKYLWLMQYHNDCVPDSEPIFADTRIDIEREVNPKT